MGGFSIPNTPKKELRAGIYKLLILEHLKPVTISRVLKIKLSTLMYHITVLLKENAILRSGYGSAASYLRGPEYHKYEMFNVQCSTLDTDSQSKLNMQNAMRRIDTAWFKCSIIKPWPEGHIWWEKEEKGLNGVTRRYKRIFWGKWSATITAYNQKSIMFQLEPFEIDEKEIPYRDEVCMSYAIQVVRIASKAFKMGLSLPELCTEPYIIEPIPELQGVHVGTIKTSPTSHIDSSKRPGRPEWETKSIEEAVVHRQMPSRMLLLEQRFLSMESKLDQVDHNIERIVKLLEKLINKITGEGEDIPIKEMDNQDKGAYR
jgi:hypothetical protein